MKKRLLVYAHYFYPDLASTGQILTELCEGLQDDFDITVICVVPSYDGFVDDKYKSMRFYNEKHGRIDIIRVRVPEFNKKSKISRVKNILAYFTNAVLATFKVGQQDLIFSISQPPILGGLLGVIGKWLKKGKFIYNIQDFNPEQSMVVGYTNNKLAIKFARTLDNFSCSQASVVVLVGRDMEYTLNKRFKENKLPHNIVINNWINENKVYPLATEDENVLEFKKKYELENKLVFMYSGNIGLYYDLENIIKVIGKFRYINDIVFAFVGDGTMKQTLVDYVEENSINNIIFIPYQNKDHIVYSLNAADVHIISNAKGIKGISVPSKIYGIMGVGKYMLGILEEGAEARRLIEECQCGICCEPGNYDDLYNLIDKIIKERDFSTGVNGRRFLEEKYTKEKSIGKYIELLNSLSK